MVKTLYILLLALVPIASVAVPPIVTDVTAAQRTDGSMKVDIYYQVQHNLVMTISAVASQNGGASWTMPCRQVSGDVGPGISSGAGKHIVWDVLRDYPNIIGSQFKVMVIADDGIIPENFIFVEGGTFFNGYSNATVSSFYMDKYEITQAKVRAILTSYAVSGYGVGDNYPAYYINWFNAINYCNRRSILEGYVPCYSYLNYGTNPDDWPSGWNWNNSYLGRITCNWSATGYRLPTEMEWQWASRGGVLSQGYIYSGSDNVNSVAWHNGNAGGATHPVGQKAPNELGFYDMSGNVEEYCWDFYGAYPTVPLINYTGPTTGDSRVDRGGAWAFVPDMCRVNYPHHAHGGEWIYSYVGFRVCRKAP